MYSLKALVILFMPLYSTTISTLLDGTLLRLFSQVPNLNPKPEPGILVDNKLLCNVLLFQFFFIVEYYMSSYERCTVCCTGVIEPPNHPVVSRFFRERTKTCRRTNQETLKNRSN